MDPRCGEIKLFAFPSYICNFSSNTYNSLLSSTTNLSFFARLNTSLEKMVMSATESTYADTLNQSPSLVPKIHGLARAEIS